MKYFLQFEGNEKLFTKIILIFQIITMIILIIFIFTDRPVDVYFTNEELKALCEKL